MKKLYNAPLMEMQLVHATDVIATSTEIHDQLRTVAEGFGDVKYWNNQA